MKAVCFVMVYLWASTQIGDRPPKAPYGSGSGLDKARGYRLRKESVEECMMAVVGLQDLKVCSIDY